MADPRSLQADLKLVDDLLRRGQSAEAERRMLALRARLPLDPFVAYQLGCVWLAQGRAAEAARVWQQAMAAKPDWVHPVVALANAAKSLGHRQDCLRYCTQALRLAPGEPQVLLNYAVSLRELGCLPEALAAVDKALVGIPGSLPARSLRMDALCRLRRLDEGEAEAERMLAIAPDDAIALATLVRLRQQRCAFAEASGPSRLLVAAAAAGRPDIQLLELARLSDDPALLAVAARGGTSARRAPGTAPMASRAEGRPLTIAYLSGDLRNHAVGHMLMDVLAAHDRSRVRVLTIGTKPDDGSSEGARLRQLADEHLDLGELDDPVISERIRHAKVDVLIDLVGCTETSRPGILAGRPAPVQVMWLGCPVTTGARWYDAWLVDDYVAPEGYDQHASEPLLRLPCSYHPIGSGGGVDADRALRRSDLGLPESVPLLAALHQSVKLNAEMVDAWMRIAASHPHAVLWLAVANPAARELLRGRAQGNGFDPGRLVFAEYEPDRARYLARWRLADLALDSYPYGGHSTVGEALSAGCPVLTRCGRSIPSRVAGSMLHQSGLHELIAQDLPGYEAIARGLLADPARLAELRGRCAAVGQRIIAERNRGLTRALEDAYATLHVRACQRAAVK